MAPVVRTFVAGTRRTARRLVAAIAFSLAVVGCGDDDGATAGSAREPWGPLAVISGPPSGAEALIAGSLRITESCVSLTEGVDGPTVLLVWPSDGTTWNASSSLIGYDDGERAVELADGDDVTFAGGGDSVQEGGLPATEWIDSVDGWVSEPDPSCPADIRWFVGGLPPTGSTDS